MKKNIYLDYAAATPVDKQVQAAMEPYFGEIFHNPSATYLAGRSARKELEKIRASVSSVIGAKPAEVIFTAGATEANNLAIQGLMRQFPDGEVIVSAIEHESVLEPARLFKHKQAPVDKLGIILLNKLSNLVSDKTVLVSVMMANNELGTIQPLGDIAALVAHFRRDRLKRGNNLPLYLHTDAAQAGNYLSLHSGRLGVDMMSINGGKLYGPKQSGVLYIKAGIRLQPQIAGGGQEFGLRSGTENLAAAAGFAKALQTAQQRREKESKRVAQLSVYFGRRLNEIIPTAVINGSHKHRAPHILNVTFPGRDNERLMMELDEAGIQCAVGSACSASRGEASHVLSAIGLSDDLARTTLRFSLGRHTTKSDIEKTVTELSRLTASNR